MIQNPQPEISAESVKSKPSFRDKAVEELREFLILTIYLYVCFAAIIYLKAAVLQAHGIIYAPLGVAIIKAALCAKFMLLGRAMHLGERFRNLPLIVPTLHRAFIFLVLLAVLTFIEEIVVGALHGRTVMQAISEIAGGTLPQMAATTLIIFLILIPYFAFQSLADVVGVNRLKQLFFERRTDPGQYQL